MWWDTTQIEATVTRQFVCSKLLSDEIQKLDWPLGFGDGLTDGTYWEWIREKAPRIFLILVDLGVPDQIFGIVDDSWDDDDLPIGLEQIERLALTATRNGKVDRRFYYRQFHYLIRTLEKGEHAVYSDDEIIPLEIVDRRPVAGLSQNHSVDKVELPNFPGKVFSRRRIPVGTAQGMLSGTDFLREINCTKNIQNDHLVSYFSSYTHQNFGYVLFTPASDYNLKTILGALPAPLKALSKQDRRVHVMNWIHCLVDTLCYLHSRGWAHGQIKPSTVLFNTKHDVFFTDLSRLSAETLANSSDKAAFDRESYIYAAPEQWFRPSTVAMNTPRRPTLNSPPSTSPSDHTFSIPRHGSEPSNNLTPASHTPTPNLNPQAADIFSLGCVILELLGLQVKRQTRSFAAHRAAKHKMPGRGGAVPDSSFHKNLGQVESWMAGLAKDASKKSDAIFRGVAPMCKVVARMLSVAPHDRPTAQEVEQETYKVLRESGISEPHCVHQYGSGGGGGLDYGMSGLSISRENEVPATPTDVADGDEYDGFQYNPPVIIGKRPSVVGGGGFAEAATSSKSSFDYTQGYKRASGSSSGGSRGRDSPTLSGFEAIQNIRVNKVRNWQAPAYTGI
ncbi:hypothetical protein PG996_003528 [Apiospora saccharicola]|uniref:Protein kinase domain-containing protein n=1 Tax=Apiospora saccharicola TaxID=335842 RepID=A0ABR1W5D5_9PEZI